MTGGSAHTWAQNETETIITNTLTTNSLEEFLKHLEKAFGDPDHARTAHTKLHDLKMTPSISADDYTAQFEMLSGQTSFNDEALKDAYAQGLPASILDKIHSLLSIPSNLKAWKKTACQIDRNHCCLLEVKQAQAPHPSGRPTPLQTCSSPITITPVTPPASEGETETVGKPTGKAPDTQNVWDVTETVTEERAVEETSPNTWEQVLQCLSTERCEMTGESSNCTGKAQPQEVTKQSPPDHERDQEESEDEESSSEVNLRADQMEFIKEFQEVMNQAIEQLLKKSVTRHPHQKDKPEPCMEQGKRKETICKEAEMLPPRNASRESDNEQNSRVLLEMMDTDRCIQKLIRTEL